jgi:pimeloyl-ACP methyl ester carboxylesterase
MDWLDMANRAMKRVLLAQGVESSRRVVLGNQMHFYRYKGEGKGPPLLLVHGLGSSANAYIRTIVPLGRRFREVWAIDLPGNSFSPLPAAGALPVRTLVEVVVAFQKEVIREPVFLVGNSLGGAMSLFAAHASPQSFRALALISPAGARMSPDRVQRLKESFNVQSVSEARAMTRRLFHRPPLALLLFASELQKLYGSATVRSIIGEVTPEDAVTEEMLKGLPMPVMLIWGKSEKLLPYESIDYFRAHLPRQAEVHEVKGFGHMPQMEHPGEVVRRLIRFADERGLSH